MMQQMLLGSGDGDTAHLENDSAYGFIESPSEATAFVRFDSDGGVYNVEQGVSTLQYTWRTGPNAASEYSVRYTSVGGGDALTTEAAAINTWIALSTDRTYGYSASATTRTGTVTFEIKANGSGLVLATCAVGITAESSI
jgi:hypothetical protein